MSNVSTHECSVCNGLFYIRIAMVAYANNERMARRIDYLLEEVRVLREVYSETIGQLLATLRRDGTTQAELAHMTTFHELNRLLGLEEKYEREQSLAAPQSPAQR